jgi:histidinol-phosphate aminotransferase
MPEPRKAILQTPFDPHGGPDGTARAPLDFSVNSNPLGPPAGLLEALERVDIGTYPDPTNRVIRDHAAARHGVQPEQIVFANGTADLIHRLAAAYLHPQARVVIAGPTFGEYARASRLQGAQVIQADVYTGQLQPDLQGLVRTITEVRPALVWLCHPNNPTGHAWSHTALDELAATCAHEDALLVIDAVYLHLSDVQDPHLHRDSLQDALQLHSLTKTYRMPGVRIGYAVARSDVARVLEQIAPPWMVSAHAQAAAWWAFTPDGQTFIQETVPRLMQWRTVFRDELRALGLEVAETRTSFFLVRTDSAARLKARAEEAGIRIRDGSSFGLPKDVRIATQHPEDNARLLTWWRDVCRQDS